jgi:hypothetical protein
MSTIEVQTSRGFEVEYLLFSEFDIDRGSVVRCQWPHPYPYRTESEIAEQALPDGSHNCKEDTTVFFVRHNFEKNRSPLESPVSTLSDESIIEEKEVNSVFLNTSQSVDSPKQDEQNNSSIQIDPPTPRPLDMPKTDVDTVFHYGLNFYMQKKIVNARRGTRVKAVCVLSKKPEILSLKVCLFE